MTTQRDPQASDAVDRLGRVHFIGAGGVGMSGLARILLDRGRTVSGSDARESPTLTALRQRGARMSAGHDAANLDGVDTVVVSTAIRESNPELARARREGLPVLHRSELLAALMHGRRAVAVAGTHGKTTTTSMVVTALEHCGVDPSFAIGGELTGREAERASAHEGSGEAFVAEADESDASFLRYSPEVAVVTNVEPDHLDHYGTAEAVYAAFADFADRIVPGGLLVIGVDDAGARDLAERVRSRRDDITVIGYGRAAHAQVRIVDPQAVGGGMRAELVVTDALAGKGFASEASLTLQVPGEHNLANATAAWIVAIHLGADPVCAAQGLNGFGGTRRRFELIGRVAGLEIRDDYAHHPTEVAAALRAARGVGPQRLVVLFQPHLYSRTRIFAAEFAQALALADEVFVLDVYGAREDPEPGVSGRLISDAVPLAPERVHFVADLDAALAALEACVRSGDLVLTMGAGDVTSIGPRLRRQMGDRPLPVAQGSPERESQGGSR